MLAVDRRSMLRLALLALVWGSSFLLIKVGLRGMTPSQLVLTRLVFGAGVLLVVLLLRRLRLPTGWRIWGHLAVLAVTANVVPFVLFAWGEQRIPSGLAGILNATTPLLTVIVAVVVLPDERASFMRAIGIAVGFAGVVLIIAPWHSTGSRSIAGELACLGAAACYGVAFTYTRRFVSGRASPLALATGQLGVAALLQLAVTIAAHEPSPHLTVKVLGAAVTLGAVNTGLAYLLYYSLIRDVGATSASMVTYLMPIVAVVLGVGLLGEKVTWNLFAGAAVVIAGVSLAEGRLGVRSRPPVPTGG
jgi:drug/metabolite transporter (DMT)-like permease